MPRFSFPQVSRPPLNLKLCTRWNWFVRFTPRPLYLQANKPRHPLNRRSGGPRRWCARFWWREISLSPPPYHHHHAFKDWCLVARSSLNKSLCNGRTMLVLPAGWFYNTACGSLCPPSLLTRCAHLLSQLLNCTKTARISNSFKMAHYLKQITFCVHHSGVVLQLMIPVCATKMRIATVMGVNGGHSDVIMCGNEVGLSPSGWARHTTTVSVLRLGTCANMHGLFERCCWLLWMKNVLRSVQLEGQSYCNGCYSVYCNMFRPSTEHNHGNLITSMEIKHDLH